MYSILLLGAGKIGRMVAHFLIETGDFDVLVADSNPQALDYLAATTGATTRLVDANDTRQLRAAMLDRQSVISALSFHFNPTVARAALERGASYFDITEDVETTAQVRAIAESACSTQIFMPQCGLAPGFISIVANHLVQEFERPETVRMRVGALPQFPTDALKYNLTWSTDGLINEYCNPCDAIHESQRMNVLPLEQLEHFSLDGDRYEAFNTSGGLGTLCDTLAGCVRELNYKTIRYMGHCDLVRFLINDLRLGRRRELLKEILEQSVPITFQDVVVTFCTVTGRRRGQLVQVSDARKLYCQTIGGEIWSAIQISTASAVCAVVDLHREGRLPERGFVRQEQVDFDAFRKNRLGGYYDAASIVTAIDDDHRSGA